MTEGNNEGFYRLQCMDVNGNILSFDSLRNKVVLVVNVASLCGFSPQYSDLQALYKKYEGKLVILGFPCNQFGKQEPLTGKALIDHIRAHFQVLFPIMDKIDVNGDNAHPVYRYLKDKKSGTLGFKGIQWNFEKFLVSSKGEVIERYTSNIPPRSFEFLIEKLVKEINI